MTSLEYMNVLEVVFDSKLWWAQHVATTITKANIALSAIRLISRYFNNKELLCLITSNYFLILCHNLEIWHMPNLKTQLQQLLLSASARALKGCLFKPDIGISFVKIHEINYRAIPDRIMIYKHSLLFFKLYNQIQPLTKWTHLNLQHLFLWARACSLSPKLTCIK
jgi:hypothetical protein